MVTVSLHGAPPVTFPTGVHVSSADIALIVVQDGQSRVLAAFPADELNGFTIGPAVDPAPAQ